MGDLCRNLDFLFPYVLLAIWEMPQTSMGFTPFELLFGRKPRGLLDVACKALEEQPSPFRSLVEYIQEMQEWIDWVMAIFCEHMEVAQ